MPEITMTPAELAQAAEELLQHLGLAGATDPVRALMLRNYARVAVQLDRFAPSAAGEYPEACRRLFKLAHRLGITPHSYLQDAVRTERGRPDNHLLGGRAIDRP